MIIYCCTSIKYNSINNISVIKGYKWSFQAIINDELNYFYNTAVWIFLIHWRKFRLKPLLR